MTRTRKVVHLTSVHEPGDLRIRLKECAAAAAAGWSVVLVAPADADASAADGVQLRAVPRPVARWRRMLQTTWQVYQVARAEPADLYQFHDAELMPWALLLRWSGRRVVYDAHEDLAGTIGYKEYLSRPFRWVLGRVVGGIERFVVARCSAVVAATPHIGESVGRSGVPVTVVQNFPRLEELALGTAPRPYQERAPGVLYLGAISRQRGAKEMVEAVRRLSHRPDVRLHVAGRWAPSSLREELAAGPGWDQVVDHGFLGRAGVMTLLGTCRIGVVTIWPERNYLLSYATKMFEYMAAGLPVVASDFPLWRQIIEETDCGLVVDPRDPTAIAAAIDRLLADPAAAERMGARGRAAVLARYNWAAEARKLLELYDALVPATGGEAA